MNFNHKSGENMKKFLIILFSILIAVIIGCSEDSPVDSNDNSDIPPDPTNVTVPPTTINNISPAANFSKSPTTSNRILINLTGMLNPATNQPIQLTAQSNFFVTEDGVVKGMKVTGVGTGNVLKADIVFSVDNSGSMNQEADSIAASIIKFAQTLQASGLDVLFGIVGYNGEVSGAINFTTAPLIEAYLNRTFSGTSRTRQFGGLDSAALETKASNFAPGIGGENGIVGILFADSNFTWRSDAQRVFINFTDEPTQPSNQFIWGTENLCNLVGGSATIHTVWSGSADTANASSWSTLQRERPWDMSTCSGGTVVVIPSSGEGLDLSELPVTGALANSYLVEFVTSNPNVPHTVEITVKESNADGKRTYNNLTY
jgi:hypothetical protein